MSCLTPLALLAVLLLSAETVLAQAAHPLFRPGPSSQGTAEDQKACRGDARRYCRSVLQDGDFAVLTCLRENRAKLNQGCRDVLTRHGQ